MGKRLRLYKTYSFSDQDPVIDMMHTAVKRSGASYQAIHQLSGVSTSTMGNWFNGKTKRPQFATIAATAAALGFTGYDWHNKVFTRRSGPRLIYTNAKKARR